MFVWHVVFMVCFGWTNIVTSQSNFFLVSTVLSHAFDTSFLLVAVWSCHMIKDMTLRLITIIMSHMVQWGVVLLVVEGLYRAVKWGQTGDGQIKCYNNTRTNGPKIPNRAHSAIQLNASQTTVEQMGNKTKLWFTKPFSEDGIKIYSTTTDKQLF